MVIVPFGVLSIVVLPAFDYYFSIDEVEELFSRLDEKGIRVMVLISEKEHSKYGVTVEKSIRRGYLLLPSSIWNLNLYSFEKYDNNDGTLAVSENGFLFWLISYGIWIALFFKFSIKHYAQVLKNESSI